MSKLTLKTEGDTRVVVTRRFAGPAEFKARKSQWLSRPSKRRTFSHNRRVRGSVLLRVLQGTADANIRFADLRSLLLELGFEERVKGSHHIFTRSDVVEILNLQPRGSLAKPYQVKQVRKILIRYKLANSVE